MPVIRGQAPTCCKLGDTIHLSYLYIKNFAHRIVELKLIVCVTVVYFLLNCSEWEGTVVRSPVNCAVLYLSGEIGFS